MASGLRSRSWLAWLSVVGSGIVAAGFAYPSLFVVVTRGCFPRTCHQIVTQYTILSGAQIMALRAHPIAPPYIWFVAYPPGISSFVPLIAGGGALGIGIVGLLRVAPRWLRITQLAVAVIGALFLLYDSYLWWRVATGHFTGFPVTLTLSPLAIAGHALLYVGYMLLFAGMIAHLWRDPASAATAHGVTSAPAPMPSR